MICHVVIVAEPANYVLLSGGTTWRFWCPHDRYIQSPYSLSSEWVDSFPSKSLYSGILALPLSIFGLGRDVLGGSRGPLNRVKIGLSPNVSLSRLSSSVSMSNSVSIGSDGVESTVYQDVDSSNMKSLLTRTVLVEGLKPLYSFYSSKYPTRIHFSDLWSSFCCFSSGICWNAIESNNLMWNKCGFLP